jgi:hypothetical protein
VASRVDFSPTPFAQPFERGHDRLARTISAPPFMTRNDRERTGRSDVPQVLEQEG